MDPTKINSLVPQKGHALKPDTSAMRAIFKYWIPGTCIFLVLVSYKVIVMVLVVVLVGK